MIKYIFSIEVPNKLSEQDKDILQKEFNDNMIQHFKEGMFKEGTIKLIKEIQL